MARASRSKRSLKGPKLVLMATSRFRRVSRAFQTSPMPPAPSAERISYGPSRVPGARGKVAPLLLFLLSLLALGPVLPHPFTHAFPAVRRNRPPPASERIHIGAPAAARGLVGRPATPKLWIGTKDRLPLLVDLL